MSEESPMAARVGSAGLYAWSSFSIVVMNKFVLTHHHFPSYEFLGIGQMTATIAILGVLNLLGKIKLPKAEWKTVVKIWPLPLFYMCNLVTGLGSTQALSLPMMTVLRRFSILMTLGGEYFYLGKKPSTAVALSVFGMVAGAIIAAGNDLSFDLRGYTLVLLSDFFTAANGVVSKSKLEARDLGKNGLTFYNALVSIVPLSLYTTYKGDIPKVMAYEGWSNPSFLSSFLGSCVMGTALMYTTVLCTHHNSALTTTVIGCLKNIVITYYGMVFGSDYIFSWVNFIGLNISILASIVFSYVTFAERPTLPVSVHQNGGASMKNGGGKVITT